jgi:hypothetical protein
LITMKRAIGIFLLVILAGAQVGLAVPALAAPCETCRDGCTPGEDCGADCLLCAACCSGLVGSLVSPVSMPAPMPTASVMPPEGVLSLPRHHTEILHIPESTLA